MAFVVFLAIRVLRELRYEIRASVTQGQALKNSPTTHEALHNAQRLMRGGLTNGGRDLATCLGQALSALLGG